jgi:arginyl-tRNA--protein-N-Asp/Glu arginylyltransferase
MFAKRYFPSKIQHEELDLLLANGWYRLGDSIFTTHFIKFDEIFYSAIWLRVDLSAWKNDATFHRLCNRNKQLEVRYSKMQIRDDLRNLFRLYRANVKFKSDTSLDNLLYGESNTDNFTSYLIEVFDQNQLVGAGVFDIGLHTAAGITSFYDPSYKKFSIGKFIIYQKMKYCQQNGIQYFYPGYVVPGYAAFDYKLDIAKAHLEYFCIQDYQWHAIATIHDKIPIEDMQQNLLFLQDALRLNEINPALLYYPFFDIQLMTSFQHDRYLDFPIFLWIASREENVVVDLIVYDIRHNQFHYLQCRKVWSIQLSSMQSNCFTDGVLQIEQVLYTTAKIQELIHFIQTV